MTPASWIMRPWKRARHGVGKMANAAMWLLEFLVWSGPRYRDGWRNSG
jgi:hypothetical protein